MAQSSCLVLILCILLIEVPNLLTRRSQNPSNEAEMGAESLVVNFLPTKLPATTISNKTLVVLCEPTTFPPRCLV